MAKLRVGILRGGLGGEYEISLKNGSEIIRSINDRFEIIDILIDKNKNWYVNGLLSSPLEIVPRVDIVFNALHGEYGGDGQVQKILEDMGIPFTGPGVFGAALSLNKRLTKKILINEGIKTPQFIFGKVSEGRNEIINKVFSSISPPWVVKPNNRGSSLGTNLVKNKEELLRACAIAFTFSDEIIIEEYISGREATLGVIANFRHKDIYTLLPVEIRLAKNCPIFDYSGKYSNEVEKICPGRFLTQEGEEMAEIASLIHKKMFLNNYSRSDFIISPKRGIYFLEVNPLPALIPESSFPKSLTAIGCDLADFIEGAIKSSLN